MKQLLNQVSESLIELVAGAAPLLTAIRVGPNRHVTGFLWRGDMVVTTDQALPASVGYSLVLSNGALISARPGPRDPGHNLAALRLDTPVHAPVTEPAHGTAIVLTPCSGQSERGVRARITVVNCIVSRCRQVRSGAQS